MIFEMRFAGQKKPPAPGGKIGAAGRGLALQFPSSPGLTRPAQKPESRGRTLITAGEIADALSVDRSKRNVTRLTDRMRREGVDLRALLAAAREQEHRVQWYMTWLLSHYVQEKPDAGNKAQRWIWETLRESNSSSVQRDLWRTLSFVELEEDIAGDVFDAAMRVVASPMHPIAVRAHAMYTARNVALPYAELRRELGLVLEGLSPDESPAIRARRRKVLKELRNAADQPAY